MEFDDEFEEFEEFPQREKRLHSIIERLKQFDGNNIPRKKVFRILFEELSKFGIISRSALRDYYHNLRDLGVIQELGKQKVKNEEGIEEITNMVKINLKAIKDIDFFHKVSIGFKRKV